MSVSVSTLREEFKKHIKPFVSDISKYSTHSMKSGAASNPACRKIASDLLDIHTGWRCESTKHVRRQNCLRTLQIDEAYNVNTTLV